MKLGERIRLLRQERGWRQADLAEEIGHTISSISDLETGGKKGRLIPLASIAFAFDMSLRDLLAGVDDMGEQTEGAHPLALRELKDDPYWGPQLDDEWMRVLSRVEHQGRRPETTTDYLSIFLFLRRML